MPVPTDSTLPLDLLTREERSLLPTAQSTRLRGAGATTDVHIHPLVQHVFLAAVERGGLVYVHVTETPRTTADLGDLARFGNVEIAWSHSGAHAGVVTLENGGVALLAARWSSCNVVVAGRSPDAVRAAAERLAGELRAEPPPDDRIPMRFWSSEGSSGYDVRRAIEVPEWPEIALIWRVPVGIATLARASRGSP